MRHRHLDAPGGTWSVATVESVLDRGGASDVVALLKEIRRDPFGTAADAALTAAKHSDVYGYAPLIEACLEEWRGEAPRLRLGSGPRRGR